MDSCNFTNKANSHAFEVEIYTLQKLCHFGRYDVKAKLFYQKSFVPTTRAGVFIWENFHPGYRDLGRKNRDLGNRASPASHMKTSNFYGEKTGEARSQKPSQPGRPGSYQEALDGYVIKRNFALVQKGRWGGCRGRSAQVVSRTSTTP